MPTDPFPLLGHRVVLRHQVGTQQDRPLFSDAVGELDREGGQWLIHTRRGPVIVHPGAVRAIREIPDARPRRAPLAAISELERVCAQTWPAPVSEPLGEWVLRAADGFTGRANSALVIGDPGMPVSDALARVVTFAARHRVPPRALVPQGTRWEAALQRSGWIIEQEYPGSPVSVRVAALDVVRGAGPVEASVIEITLDGEPVPQWWRMVAGTDRPEPAARAVLAGGGVGYGLARVAGVVVGAVRAAVLDGWLHLARLTVDPSYRRTGVGRALTVAAAEWAAGQGARRGVVQMPVANTAADRLYTVLGFAEHHRYRYWAPPR